MEASTFDQPRSNSKPVNAPHSDLLSHNTLPDVTFIVGPRKERIPCHTASLIARSPVFEVMFSERWNQDNHKEIPIEDVRPKIFKKFLQFIYADTIKANVLETFELLQLAHFYLVQQLVSRCEELLLEKEMTLDNAVDVFQAAQKYDMGQLMDKAGDLMAKSLYELQSHQSFSRVDKETLVYILKRDCLDMKEVDLFRLAVKWAQNQDDGLTLEKTLEDILPLIRFLTMTPEEFADTVVPTSLISQSTLVQVLTYFGTNAENKKLLVSTLKFNTQKRRWIHYYDLNSGDLGRKRTKGRKVKTLSDYIKISTRCTGATAMGLSSVIVYCPPKVVSDASRPTSATFKDFSIVLQSVREANGIVSCDWTQSLLEMSPVKVEEGEMAEIKLNTVAPLVNNSNYRMTVKEIPRSRTQVAASKGDLYAVKDFVRNRKRGFILNISNESVVIEGGQEGMDDEPERPRLIVRLGLEKL